MCNGYSAHRPFQVLWGENRPLPPLRSVPPRGVHRASWAPPGRGKTTLFQILLGLTPPDSGKIEGLDGLRCSAVFQEERLLEGLSALENVAFVLPRGFSREIIGEHLLGPWALGGANLFQCGSCSGGHAAAGQPGPGGFFPPATCCCWTSPSKGWMKHPGRKP